MIKLIKNIIVTGYLLTAGIAYSQQKINIIQQNTLLSTPSDNEYINVFKDLMKAMSNGDVETASKKTANPKEYKNQMNPIKEANSAEALKKMYNGILENATVYCILTLGDKGILGILHKDFLGQNTFVNINGKTLFYNESISESNDKELKQLSEKFIEIRDEYDQQ